LGRDIKDLFLSEGEYIYNEAHATYMRNLERGVARELARIHLPVGGYTQWYWKIDLHNLLHFCNLRMRPNALLELQMYANFIGTAIIRSWCPLAWEAFQDYRFQGNSMSRMEMDVV
ncbi:MAG: thymidylate synthase (FAD), partial [Anaerolineae bacterium]|nr:thymidylate synthase (FAD) [Anaerolineae bacterium]NIN99284.1 thymidylate synthase (FAD) [Anaerolineae bacterium]NIQ82122.1 thymidylate synthase (FAD) [Anaerolineae bacterium]